MRVIQDNNFVLGTLGASTAMLSATKIDAARLQGAVPKDLGYAINFVGKTANEGPIFVGLSAGLSIAEVAEWFAADPQRQAEPNDAEASHRPVLVLDVLRRHETTSLGGRGRWRTARWPGWHVREGVALDWFAINEGAALTTGTLIGCALQVRGNWLDD